MKSNDLSRINGRDVYVDNNGNLYGADTQHGRFEYHDKRGNHLGEFDIDGMDLVKIVDINFARLSG